MISANVAACKYAFGILLCDAGGQCRRRSSSSLFADVSWRRECDSPRWNSVRAAHHAPTLGKKSDSKDLPHVGILTCDGTSLDPSMASGVSLDVCILQLYSVIT